MPTPLYMTRVSFFEWVVKGFCEYDSRQWMPWLKKFAQMQGANPLRHTALSIPKASRPHQPLMIGALMAEKKVKGRKRHIVVDAMGNLLSVVVHAANTHDAQDLSFDSTFCKVHQHAAGAKRGSKN